jgi:hypothetical protein
MKKVSITVFVNFLLWMAVGVASGQSNGSGRLTGTWDTVVTPRVCATGDAITTFQATYIFDLAGTFSGLSSGTGSGGRGREQQGVWKHVDGDKYLFRIKTYLFNAAGVATSYQVVTHNAVLDKNGLKWSSTGISKTFTLNGAEINAGCSTIVATRAADL